MSMTTGPEEPEEDEFKAILRSGACYCVTEIHQSRPVPGPFCYAMLRTPELTVMVVGGQGVTSWVRALAQRHSVAQPARAKVHMAQSSWEPGR